MRTHTSTGWTMLALCALLAGCSSSPGIEGTQPAGRSVVELTVVNRADGTAVVFAEWGEARRTRLGTLRAGASTTFTTPYRGPSLRLGVESSTPPPVTTNVRVATESPTAAVDPGDRVVFEITRLDPVSVFYRRARP